MRPPNAALLRAMFGGRRTQRAKHATSTPTALEPTVQSARDLLGNRALPRQAQPEAVAADTVARPEGLVARLVPLRGFLPKDSQGRIAHGLRQWLPARAIGEFADWPAHRRAAAERAVGTALDVLRDVEELARARPFLALQPAETEHIASAGLRFVEALSARDMLLHIGMLALSLGWDEEAGLIVDAVRPRCPAPAQVGAWMASIYAYSARPDAAQATIEGSLCEGLAPEERRKLLQALYRVREAESACTTF